MSERSKFLSVAKSQIGTIGGDKYRKWYNENVGNIGGGQWAWCAAGISWCAAQAGVPRTVIAPTASAPTMLHNFQNAGRFKRAGGGYTPIGGDIIIFKWADNYESDASHVGIVESSSGGCVNTIEFNTGTRSDGEVARHSYPLTASYIVGYGVPDFGDGEPVYCTTIDGGSVYDRDWKDPLGGASEVVATFKTNAKLEFLEDAGYGWSKVKYKGKVGYIMNTHFRKKVRGRLSTFSELTLLSNKKAIAFVNKRNTKETRLPSGTAVKIISEIEDGQYKGWMYVKANGLKYYIKAV